MPRMATRFPRPPLDEILSAEGLRACARFGWSFRACGRFGGSLRACARFHWPVSRRARRSATRFVGFLCGFCHTDPNARKIEWFRYGPALRYSCSRALSANSRASIEVGSLACSRPRCEVTARPSGASSSVTPRRQPRDGVKGLHRKCGRNTCTRSRMRMCYGLDD